MKLWGHDYRSVDMPKLKLNPYFTNNMQINVCVDQKTFNAINALCESKGLSRSMVTRKLLQLALPAAIKRPSILMEIPSK